jgi:single-strand DNA-binding protein
MQLNRTMLAGNVTRDPQLKALPGGTSVCEFGIATNRKWKGPDGAEKEEVTFVDCAAFGKKGEAIARFFQKGKPIYVEGRLKFDTWEKDGQKRSKLSVTVDDFQFVGKKEGGETSATPATDEDAF